MQWPGHRLEPAGRTAADDGYAHRGIRAAPSKQRHELLSLVAAHTIHAVVITDALGLIQWANPSFTRITGYSLDEVRGKKPGQVLQGPESDLAAVARIREAVAQGRSCEETLTNYTKTGSRTPSRSRSIRCAMPRRRGLALYRGADDVTEQVKVQRELGQSEVR